ncbi:triphosphoribosyl-dephospho-CoA synthase CitG [Pediococcus claussenii]|uniref:triphosphoribosyl-dephospho-CoA synthase CitG n=1 Tax=Pediococcus claussenii TaxID=187452 RepID=UPI00081AA50D|nr:triphosphoribosyl-dephospho-CoA synthase CitG [Pediococcus claussenii]ANZ69792.1 triphosphoribosyl-dephospho-CoA synthase [Pediococcus claussenii]ANZ71609.1 triphosphoribosyl-dephospho-CoA synthase [Pediococcus claussenii]
MRIEENSQHQSFQDLKKLVVQNAVKSMLYEVTVTPKPGLVDPQSSGPHPDMDAFNFIDSALSLEFYFNSSFIAGWRFEEDDYQTLFNQIRELGIAAEKTMFSATNGINTHKGAVFSLGVVVAASAVNLSGETFDTRKVLECVKLMLQGLVEKDFKGVRSKELSELTAGERQYLLYGETGIRGEAEQGYPTVIEHALPFLMQSKGTTDQRLLDTLMTIVASSNDSNLIKRAGNNKIVEWAHQQAQEFLDLGGSLTRSGMAKLLELNQTFYDRNLSLGGSADLLIVTIFFGLMQGTL